MHLNYMHTGLSKWHRDHQHDADQDAQGKLSLAWEGPLEQGESSNKRIYIYIYVRVDKKTQTQIVHLVFWKLLCVFVLLFCFC